MKCLLIFFLPVAMPLIAYSQTDTLRISLDEAIAYGIKNRYDIQSNEINTLLAKNEVNKYKKEWLPEITGTGTIRYNTQLQETVTPAGFGGSNSTQKIAFGTKNNTSFSLDLSQPLYKPGLSSDIRISANNSELEYEINEKSKTEIKFEITEAYLNVLLREIQYNTSLTKEHRNKTYLEVSESKYTNGTLVESNFLETRLNYENSKRDTQKAKQNYELSMIHLAFKINLPQGVTLVLTDDLNKQDMENPTDEQASKEGDHSEIKQLYLKQRENTMQLQKARYNALPSFYFIANYTTQFQDNDFAYTKGSWSPYNYIGIRMNIPITSNFKNANTIKDYRLKQVQTDYDLKQKKIAIDYEIQENKIAYSNSMESLINSRNTYELSLQVYNRSLTEYELGTKHYDSLLDTEESLQTAEENYMTSVYDYLVAKINLKKSIEE